MLWSYTQKIEVFNSLKGSIRLGVELHPALRLTMSADNGIEASVDSQSQPQVNAPVPTPQPGSQVVPAPAPVATPPEFNPALMHMLGDYLRSNPQALDDLFKQHIAQPVAVPSVESCVPKPVADEPSLPEPIPVEAQSESSVPVVPEAELAPSRILTAAERFTQINEQFVELARSGTEQTLRDFVSKYPGLVQIRFRDFAAWWASVEGANLETCKFLRTQFANEIGNRRYDALYIASSSNNKAGVEMLLHPALGLSGKESFAAIEVAGENGNAEIVNILVNDLLSRFTPTQCLMAAVCGTLRSDNTELLSDLLTQLKDNNDVTKNNPKRNFRYVLIQAARLGSPVALGKVLSTLNMQFQHKPTSNHVRNTLCSDFSNGSTNTSTLRYAFDICAENPDNRLVNLLVDMFGEDMFVHDGYNCCMESGCQNGHAKLVKLLITKHKFVDIPKYANTARINNQAEVLAVLFDKFGLDAIMSAPEHIPRTNELLRQHYATLVGRFSI